MIVTPAAAIRMNAEAMPDTSAPVFDSGCVPEGLRPAALLTSVLPALLPPLPLPPLPPLLPLLPLVSRTTEACAWPGSTLTTFLPSALSVTLAL